MDNTYYLDKRLIYLGLAVLLILPIYLLGHPGSHDAENNFSGGMLANYRQNLKPPLSSSRLGEINPVGETFKLATLGLRPVALAILWQKAHYYHKREDWSNYEATLNQIVTLAPYFKNTWDHLSHAITYNMSVEFDNWRDRYYYVVKGLRFLIKGTDYNEQNGLLLSKVGWFITEKIGRSDDKVLYRKKFARDKELLEFLAKKLGKENIANDSWLVGKDWYLKAIQAVKENEASKPKESEVIFHSRPGMAQIYYADNLAADGIFDDRTKRAWDIAAIDWDQYGNHPFPDSFGGFVKLKEREDDEKQLGEKLKLFANLIDPEARLKLASEKLKKLSNDQRRILATPPDKRTDLEAKVAADVELSLQVTDHDVASVASEKNRLAAKQLAREIEAIKDQIANVDTIRSHVNYEFWRAKCDAEPTPDAIEAHRLIYLALKQQRESSLADSTKTLFEQAFAKWRIVLDRFPRLFVESIPAFDLNDFLRQYRAFLADRDEKLPDDFILIDVVKKMDQQGPGQ